MRLGVREGRREVNAAAGMTGRCGAATVRFLAGALSDLAGRIIAVDEGRTAAG
jgi:hypothetical protein